MRNMALNVGDERMKKMALIFLFILFATSCFAEVAPKITVKAIRLNQQISIDGVINEPFWRDDQGISEFTQREPKEGAPATQKTVVDVGYDDSALYVAARMYDTDPKGIVARLARKDTQVDSDSFTFYIDSYHDKR